MPRKFPKNMSKNSRLLIRLRLELGLPITANAEIISYRGPKDAGQRAWWISTNTNIGSSETVTQLLQYERLDMTTPKDYRSDGWEIGGS